MTHRERSFRTAAPVRVLTVLLCSVSAVALPTFTSGQGQDAVQYNDKQVLVLPVVNVTGEKWQELKTRITDETAKALRSQLTARGFGPVADADVQGCISEEGVDLQDEENWRKDTFFKLASKSGSRYVVFTAITAATQRTRVNFFSAIPEGDVTLKCWILDAKEGKALMSAKAINAKARPKSNLFGEAKGSEAQVEAARRAVEGALKEAFGPVPKVGGG